MMIYMDRIDAENAARQKCAEQPEKVFAAVWNLQIYQWIIVTPSQAKLMLDNGFATGSGIDCWYKGYLVALDDAVAMEKSDKEKIDA